MSWDSVVRVRRRPRLVRGTIAVTVLQSSDGREIPVATPGLLRYAEFIDEVRKRATIEMCITNRHYSHKRAGNSEAVMKDRRRSGRCRAFLVTRPSAVMSSSRLSGRPLASVALKWVQTNSSGLRSGA